jgi:Ca-activated chloride channel homolog
MTTYDPNDPRLTAFALGELEENERSAVEAQLATCAESRAAVEEIRAAARLLEDELRQETSPGLAPEQRSAIEGSLTQPRRPVGRVWIQLALAASVVLCVGLAVRQSWPKSKHRGRAMELAHAAPPDRFGASAVAAPHAQKTMPGDDRPGWAFRPPGASDERVAGELGQVSPEAHGFVPAPGPLRAPAAVSEREGLEYYGRARKLSTPGESAPNTPPGDAVRDLDDGGRAQGAGRSNRRTEAQRGDSGAVGDDKAGAASLGLDRLGRGRGMGELPAKSEPAPQGSPSVALGERGVYRQNQTAASGQAKPAKQAGAALTENKPAAAAKNGQPAPSEFMYRVPESRSFAVVPPPPAGTTPKAGMAGAMGGIGGGSGGPGGPAAARSKDNFLVGGGRQAGDSSGRPVSPALAAAGGKPAAQKPAQTPLSSAPARGSMTKLTDDLALAAPREPRLLGAKPDDAKNLESRKGLDPFDQLAKEKAGDGETKEYKLRQEELAEGLKLKAQMGNEANREEFRRIIENPFIRAAGNELSTFSIDVDTASYSIVRRILNQSQWPPADAARIEELINYFPYDYPQPKGDVPFSINVDIARCPWNADHRLARIGLKGKEIPVSERPRANLVFLVDVSGSMDSPDKLPLVKAGLRMLVEQLTENDRVAIVVYASRTGVELSSVDASRKDEIRQAIDRLVPGGSTNGAAGIVLAYEQAQKNFIPNATNRVILCTDGDFNVGVSSEGELSRLIEKEAKESKVFLSVLGFGQGNLQDGKMETLADKGNGNYAYIDTLPEARKVLVDQMMGTLNTIAKDVKIQVDFNPSHVAAYRLIGYENRMLRAEDFNNDAKDAGEIGAGHTVTALYELVPPGKEEGLPGFEKSKYAKAAAKDGDADSKESLTVRLKYKAPEKDKSEAKIEVTATDEGRDFPENSTDFKFVAAVAEFGMLLHASPHKGNATFAGARELAESARGKDDYGYRAEFIEILKKAEGLPRP